MKKQFIFNILLLILLNVLIKPFWVFGIDRTVQNVTGSEAYGFYFALFNLSVLLNTFLDFGISNFNNRSIARNPGLIRDYFPKLIYSKLVLGILYLVLCLGITFALGYSTGALKLIFILAFNQFLASVLLFLRSNISGLQMYVTDSVLSVLDRFLMIIFCGLLLWTHVFNIHMNIQVFALVQTLVYLICCLTALGIVVLNGGPLVFKAVPLFSFELFRKSLPFALLGLLMITYNRADAVLLERLLGTGAAGLYAQSFRIFDAISMVPVLFASLLLPMFSRLLSEKRNIHSLIKVAFSILFPGMVILIINLIVFAKSLLDILYTESYSDSVVVFTLLMLAVIPVSLSYIFGTLLTADGKLYYLNFISALTLVLNVSLNLVFIPRFGVIAAAFTALLSQMFVALSQIFFCKKLYGIKIPVGKILLFLMFFLTTLIIAVLFYKAHTGITLKIILSVLSSAGLGIILKVINIHEILEAYKAETQ